MFDFNLKVPQKKGFNSEVENYKLLNTYQHSIAGFGADLTFWNFLGIVHAWLVDFMNRKLVVQQTLAKGRLLYRLI